jgi:valyl-tRNA synthetase
VEAMEVVTRYGSDASRMGLVAGRVPGVARPFDPRRLEEGRNFSNKLWNIARFIEGKVGDSAQLKSSPEPKTPADHWILNKLSISEREISNALENYRLSEAYETLYHFIWHDFADWYVEASKDQTNPGMLAYVLESSLKLAHPFAPFVTEAIWQTLAWPLDSSQDKENNMLAVASWPKIPQANKQVAAEFETVIAVISEARQIIKTLGVKKPALYYQNAPVLEKNATLIARMAGLPGVNAAPQDAKQGLRLTSTELTSWLDIERSVAEKYLAALMDQKQQKQAAIERLNARLSSQDYVAKAPKELVEQTRQKLAEEEKQLEAITEESIRYVKITRPTTEEDY